MALGHPADGGADSSGARRGAGPGAVPAATDSAEWVRVTLSSIGDGVITTDPECRVTFLNPVAEALTGWNHGAAMGMPMDQVFRIVNEDTRRVVENPIA